VSFSGALNRVGGAAISPRIASLRDIIDLDRAASILEFFLEQHAGDTNSSHRSIVLDSGK